MPSTIPRRGAAALTLGSALVALALLAGPLPVAAQDAPPHHPEASPSGASPEVAGAPDASTYPFVAMVRLTEQGAAARYEHPAWMGGPPNPAVTVDLGDQARTAYAVAASRMFRPSTEGPPTLDLSVSVGPATITRLTGAWIVAVEHQVVAASADGQEVAQWTVSGQDEVTGLDQRAIPAAFARAARKAAATFEQRFDASPEVGRWLAANGYRRRAPPPLAPARRDPPRPDWSAFLDVGAGSTGSLDVAARGGLEGRWVFAELGVDHWEQDFQAPPYQGPVHLTSWLVGADAGGVWRVSEGFELRGGAGLQWLSSTATKVDQRGGAANSMTIPKSSVVGSLVAAAALVSGPQGRWLGRGRLAVEGRLFAGTDVRFDAFGTTVNAASGSILLLIGAELPVAF